MFGHLTICGVPNSTLGSSNICGEKVNVWQEFPGQKQSSGPLKGGDTCLNSLSPSNTGVNNNKTLCSDFGCIQSAGDIIKTLYGIPITTLATLLVFLRRKNKLRQTHTYCLIAPAPLSARVARKQQQNMSLFIAIDLITYRSLKY